MKNVLVVALLCLPFMNGYAQLNGTEINKTYQPVADRLITAALADSSAYEQLAYMADTFGHRLSGSESLEKAIDWLLDAMQKDGFDRVYAEDVMVPAWVRGEESLTLMEPRRAPLTMLGLGGSIGTPVEGITADVLVVSSYDDLQRKKDQAKGKIVVYNVPFVSYGETVQYRATGAVRAAEAGAVASLVRSITNFSQNTPHTGSTHYDEKVTRIPHAAITVEDAMMLQRMQDRGQRIRLTLKMSATQGPDRKSRNVIAEIRGSEKPEEVVVFGGHIDSWDVGQGAQDDAAGCFAAWRALQLMKQLGLRPRRTVRLVLWTNEENGLRGGTAYKDAHFDEMPGHVLAIETDEGIFKPDGFGFTGPGEAFDVIKQIGTLLRPIDADSVFMGGGGADISPLMRYGVPGMGLSVDNSTYFWYHHAPNDTVDKVDPHHLNLCAATLAVMAYVAADLPQRIPHTAVEYTR